MNQGISSIVAAISGVAALLGVGGSAAASVATMRQQLRPPQAQVQQCPPNTDPQYVTGPNGERQLVCYVHGNGTN